MIAGLITICGGILAASGAIIARKPNAKELIDKLVPYQGWIGLVMFIWGIKEAVLGLLPNLGMFAHAPVTMVLWTAITAVLLIVGFLLGFGLITKYALSRNEAAMEKGQRIRAKLVGIQVPMGFVAIALGVLYIVLPYVL